MSYYFETKDLSVGYQGKPLIEHISIGIEKGEVVTLIGPNGSGKSTILKSITKHLATIAGTVLIGRTELGKFTYKDLAKELAVVLTERVRPELMTCRDVVASGRYPYTGSLGLLNEEDEKLINEAMEQVHVLELSERDFSAISDGQRQRVLLARAICQSPEVIVLDEPTSFLDIRHKVELLHILRTMARERQTTIIMSLHEIDLAERISDKIICVKGDHVADFGTPEEIFQRDTIQKLYQISENTFNLNFGSVELPRAEGLPQVFVLSNCGHGIPVYRRLQKQGIPFAAGLLAANDIDYQVAKALAAEVVEIPPFAEITDEVIRRAEVLMASCREIIICDPVIGPANQRLKQLVERAEQMQKEKRKE